MTDETFYGNKDDFASYLSARGRAVDNTWTPENIEAALLVASDWLDGAFFVGFTGIKTGGRDQVRQWPRMDVIDVDGYAIPSDVPPREVINATYEAAYRQLSTPGVFFKDYTPSKYRSATVVGAVSVVYADGSAYDFQSQFPAIAAILAPILARSNQGYSSLSGAVCR